jgi:hypothetical protein
VNSRRPRGTVLLDVQKVQDNMPLTAQVHVDVNAGLDGYGERSFVVGPDEPWSGWI